jgi:hypothetical protein
MTTTPTLDQLVRDAVTNTVTPDYIDAQVKSHVDKLVSEALKEALSSYSPTGKAIKAAIATALEVNNLDLPSYGHAVTRIVSDLVEKNVAEVVQGRLKADMEKLLGLAPKRIKLSEIVRGMLEDSEDVSEVHCRVEWSQYGSAWLNLHPSRLDHNQRAEVRVLISLPKKADDYARGETPEGPICSGWVEEGDIKKGRSLGAHGLCKRILAMYACGTVIDLDEDEVRTSKWGD